MLFSEIIPDFASLNLLKTRLLTVYLESASVVDSGMAVDFILLDFSKVLDISHVVLLES